MFQEIKTKINKDKSYIINLKKEKKKK